jgi:hypothetical protein
MLAYGEHAECADERGQRRRPNGLLASCVCVITGTSAPCSSVTGLGMDVPRSIRFDNALERSADILELTQILRHLTP